MTIDNLSSMSDPSSALFGIARSLRYRHSTNSAPVFITFIGVVKQGSGVHAEGHARSSRNDNYGQAFADYLRANKLGTVTASEPRVSFSKNTIQMWIWHPDYTELWKFLG